MPAWELSLIALYGLVVLGTLARHWFLSAELRAATFVGPESPTLRDGPLVSVLVPAKDEERSIGDCLRSLLRQDYARLEILVVEDRSTDRTAELVRTFAASDARVRLLQVADLPPGWTGKTHALDVAQREARGEWLLFVDADTQLAPTCVSALLHDAVTRGADLESVLPSFETSSFWESVVQPFAGACLMVLFPLSRVNDARRRDLAFANGQFLLIRRRAYDTIGGHAAVRDKFVEDVHLARRILEVDPAQPIGACMALAGQRDG